MRREGGRKGVQVRSKGGRDMINIHMFVGVCRRRMWLYLMTMARTLLVCRLCSASMKASR